MYRLTRSIGIFVLSGLLLSGLSAFVISMYMALGIWALGTFITIISICIAAVQGYSW